MKTVEFEPVLHQFPTHRVEMMAEIMLIYDGDINHIFQNAFINKIHLGCLAELDDFCINVRCKKGRQVTRKELDQQILIQQNVMWVSLFRLRHALNQLDPLVCQRISFFRAHPIILPEQFQMCPFCLPDYIR